MKQNVAIIGTSSESVYTIDMLKNNGFNVIGIDGNENADGLKHCDKSIVADIADLDLMEKIISDIKPTFIMPVPIGKCLTTVGYLNDKFNLKGINYRSCTLTTDKHIFHKTLKSANLRNINSYLSSDFSLDKMNFPLVLKPRFGSGSKDTFYIESTQTLYDKLSQITSHEDFILEEIFLGTEYGLDGAFIDNKFYLTLLRKKLMTKLPILQSTGSLSVVLSKCMADKLSNFFTDCLNALNCNNCLLQIDLIINENEDIFPIEIAPRPCGHNMYTDFVPKSTGINITQEYINFLTGNKYNFIPKQVKQTIIKFFDFEDTTIEYVPTPNDFDNKDNILDFKCNIQKGDYMDKILDGHSIINRGFFIAYGTSKNDLLTQSNKILSKFKRR